MLTHGERKFLKSDGSGYTRQTQKEHRDKIRSRVKHTLLDFSVLLEYWPKKEREKVFRELRDDTVSDGHLAGVFELLYLATSATGAFSEALQRGVRNAEYRKSFLDPPSHAVQVDFEVKYFRKAGHAVAEKYKKGPEGIEDMSEAEAKLLLDALYFDDQFYDERVVQAEKRFDKFLDEEVPEGLEKKGLVYEEMRVDREMRAKYYKQRKHPKSDDL